MKTFKNLMNNSVLEFVLAIVLTFAIWLVMKDEVNSQVFAVLFTAAIAVGKEFVNFVVCEFWNNKALGCGVLAAVLTGLALLIV